jgi:hypothetical protein
MLPLRSSSDLTLSDVKSPSLFACDVTGDMKKGLVCVGLVGVGGGVVDFGRVVGGEHLERGL